MQDFIVAAVAYYGDPTLLVWNNSTTATVVPLAFADDGYAGLSLDGSRLAAIDNAYAPAIGAPQSAWVDEFSTATGAFLTDRAGEYGPVTPPSVEGNTYIVLESPLPAAMMLPDGQSCAFGAYNPATPAATEIYVGDYAGGRLIGTIQASYDGLTVSPDGERVMVWADDIDNAILSVNSAPVPASWWAGFGLPTRPQFRGAAFSPDGTQIAITLYVRATKTVYLAIIDAATGVLAAALHAIPNGGYSNAHPIGWCRSGRIAVRASGEITPSVDSGYLRVYAIESGIVVPVGNNNTAPNQAIHIPATDLVGLFDNYAQTMSLLNVETGVVESVLQVPEAYKFETKYFITTPPRIYTPPADAFWKNVIRAVEYP